jgi:hypothetical protein
MQRTRASARQRCDIDDGPAALDVPRGSPCAEEWPFEVDRQDAVQVSFGQLIQTTPLIDARVVGPDVRCILHPDSQVQARCVSACRSVLLGLRRSRALPSASVQSCTETRTYCDARGGSSP